MTSRETIQINSILLNITGVQFQIYFSFLLLLLFYTGSYVTQTGLELMLQPKDDLGFLIYLLTAEVTATSHYTSCNRTPIGLCAD